MTRIIPAPYRRHGIDLTAATLFPSDCKTCGDINDMKGIKNTPLAVQHQDWDQGNHIPKAFSGQGAPNPRLPPVYFSFSRQYVIAPDSRDTAPTASRRDFTASSSLVLPISAAIGRIFNESHRTLPQQWAFSRLCSISTNPH